MSLFPGLLRRPSRASFARVNCRFILDDCLQFIHCYGGGTIDCGSALVWVLDGGVYSWWSGRAGPERIERLMIVMQSWLRYRWSSFDILSRDLESERRRKPCCTCILASSRGLLDRYTEGWMNGSHYQHCLTWRVGGHDALSIGHTTSISCIFPACFSMQQHSPSRNAKQSRVSSLSLPKSLFRSVVKPLQPHPHQSPGSALHSSHRSSTSRSQSCSAPSSSDRIPR